MGSSTTVVGTAPVGVNYKFNGVPVLPANFPANTFFFGAAGITTTSPKTIDMNIIGTLTVPKIMPAQEGTLEVLNGSCYPPFGATLSGALAYGDMENLTNYQ